MIYKEEATLKVGDKMKIGYACNCIGVADCNFRTCTKRFASEEVLTQIIAHNLAALSHILEVNKQRGILLFRISSDLIPFGSSEVNCLPWQTMFQKELLAIGQKAKAYGMRLSMHPGQYTLLNALKQEIVDRSIADLRYHCDVLNAMKLDASHKLILHIGGVYGEKSLAMQRFLAVYQTLDSDIQERLIIENDDRYYTLEDVLYISKQANIPVVFDNLHHEVLPSLSQYNLATCLSLVQNSWKAKDGAMKIHYSQQDEQRRIGAHARFLDTTSFMTFYQQLPFPVDIMLEVKDKDLSAEKVSTLLGFQSFDQGAVWQQYRHLILRHAPSIFQQLETKAAMLPMQAFYEQLDQARAFPKTKANGDACYRYLLEEYQHELSESEKQRCINALEKYEQGKLLESSIKKCFQKVLPAKGKRDYLFLEV